MSAIPTLEYDAIELAPRQIASSDSPKISSDPEKGLLSDVGSFGETEPIATARTGVLPWTLSWRRTRAAQPASALSRLAGLPLDQVFAELQSSPAGLLAEVVAERLARHGPNALGTARGPSNLSMAVEALVSPFNILLAILAAISAGTQSVANAIIMAIMIAASTALRFVQERKSAVEAHRLVAMVTDEVTVQRVVDGRSQSVTVDRKTVCPGDVVNFVAGDVFPGDGMMLSGDVQISQSALTGEVTPIEKSPTLVKGPYDPLSSTRVILSGTAVVAGSGSYLVCVTGNATYVAAIAALLQQARPATAFDIGMRNVSYLLIAFMLVMSPIVLVIQGVGTRDWKQAALFAVSVAVGLTPEMLPLVVTGNLAIGARKLAKKRVIVKRLDGVQNMGAMTVLCSDKTGTLTQDALECQGFVNARGVPSQHVEELACINASLQTGSRTPIDKALAKTSRDLNGYAKHDEIPFDSTRRMLSVMFTDANGQPWMASKGAVDEVLAQCTRVDMDDTVALSTNLRADILAYAAALNSEGLRLVAVAYKRELYHEDDLVFAGLCTFLDPPKEDAPASIARLHSQNVRVKILTGDAAEISYKVATDIGMTDAPFAEAVTTGSALAVMDAEQRRAAIQSCTIFAKLSPYEKLDIVRTLREAGEVVGFLGDGVNDALALRGSDVGIAVDSGTEIAKEAAGIILLEKSLDCICDGVELGRVTLVQTLKYIKMAASSNFGNVFSVVIASFWLPYDPMTPLQILLQNLLYDLSQASIPWDNVDPEMLVHARRWDSRSILRFMVFLGPTSSIFDVCTFALNTYFYKIVGADSPRDAQAQTDWFMEGFLTQVCVVYSLRTPKIPFFQSRPSRHVVATTVLMTVIALALPYLPFAKGPLEMMSPEPSYWGFLVAIVLAYSATVHLAKLLYLKTFKGDWI